jgi:hypothetical protein
MNDVKDESLQRKGRVNGGLVVAKSMRTRRSSEAPWLDHKTSVMVSVSQSKLEN